MRYGVQQSRDSSYTNNYNGLVFGCPSQLQSPLTITIVGTDVLAFKIHFDTTDGQSPLTYTVYSSISGQTTTHSVSTLGILEVNGLLAGHGTTIITITSWQYQDEAIAIKYFENVEIDIIMDKHWIDEFETQTQKTSDGEAIQYGVLANTGSITLKDKDKTLLENRQTNEEYPYFEDYLDSVDSGLRDFLVENKKAIEDWYYTPGETPEEHAAWVDSVAIPKFDLSTNKGMKKAKNQLSAYAKRLGLTEDDFDWEKYYKQITDRRKSNWGYSPDNDINIIINSMKTHAKNLSKTKGV